MDQFTSWEVATKENKWQGRNITRWRNEEYDKAFKRRRGRDGPGQARRAVHQDERPGDADHVVIPVSSRPRVRRVASKLKAPTLSGWDTDFWNLPDWYREA